MKSKGQWYAAWRNVPSAGENMPDLRQEYRIGTGPAVPNGWVGEVGLTHPRAHAMLKFWRWIDASSFEEPIIV